MEKLASEGESGSPSVVTREEEGVLDSLEFKNFMTRFFIAFVNQISLQLYWSFSSFSLV